MDPFVPKHGPLPLNGQACAYSPTPGTGYCGKPATWHVMWDGDEEAAGHFADRNLRRWMDDLGHPRAHRGCCATCGCCTTCGLGAFYDSVVSSVLRELDRIGALRAPDPTPTPEETT